AIIAASGEVSVVYNIYRHTVGQDYGDPLSYGSAWLEYTFDDTIVINGTTYWYVVTAVYNYGNEDEAESPFSDEVEVTPEAETVYELSYDDGTAETGVTPLGDGGFYAVRFTPDDYPIQILKVKYYATGAGGLTWVKLFKDDGENGMPGTQLGTDLLFTSIIEGWNEKDVSAGNIIVDGGSFYVGWGETAMSTQLGLDTDAPIEGNSYFQIPGDPWAPISDLGGYNGDLMIRAVVDVVVSITPKPSDQVPSSFSLKQNYPNPFNPVTYIPFELPKDTHVSLQIYDLKGRVVRELVSEWLPAGQYQYPLNGSDLATGIYIYRLLAGDFTMTKKMILLK
ncbi:MAG: T9SS type A sorting domain-containing protein, partial [Candidatus Marinimicrobia bacterium]|nr:T9SS type A sorting domain-containing protein [Candidatus Neomarinimicrobiota bacterium]